MEPCNKVSNLTFVSKSENMKNANTDDKANYPEICITCKRGKVCQDNGVCTYVLCRSQNEIIKI